MLIHVFQLGRKSRISAHGVSLRRAKGGYTGVVATSRIDLTSGHQNSIIIVIRPGRSVCAVAFDLPVIGS